MFCLREDVGIISVVKDLPYNPIKHDRQGLKAGAVYSSKNNKKNLHIFSAQKFKTT